MSEHLTPEEKAEWRKDAEADQWWAVESGRTLALLDALDEAERERDEAREALARVEALRDEVAEWATETVLLANCADAKSHGAGDSYRASAEAFRAVVSYLSAALAGTDPTDTEGDDRG